MLAEEGVIGAGIAHGSVHFTANVGHGLEEKLGEVAQSVGGAMRDAALSHSVEDFGEDVVDIGDGVEVAGEGDKLGAELFFLGEAVKFFCMSGAEARVIGTARHAATASVGVSEGTATRGNWSWS